MHPNEDYVLKVLEDVGLVTNSQIEKARSRLNGAANVVDVLVRDGVVSETDISRTLATQAHMDWIDLSAKIIPPDVINQIRGEDARRFKV
ncbi:MAG: type II/IV secretion system protein, partial [Verrucomicrobiota bacterium]|nr:type II/IV secretion system protein [Verrucomicrobiota bacterium]